MTLVLAGTKLDNPTGELFQKKSKVQLASPQKCIAKIAQKILSLENKLALEFSLNELRITKDKLKMRSEIVVNISTKNTRLYF